MTSIKSLQPPAYTEDEKLALIDFVLALRKTHLQAFLRRAELPVSGAKTEFRERVQSALDDGRVSYEDLVDLLDSVAPWGKQHVFLFTGPRSAIRQWNDPEFVQQILKSHRVGKYFNARLPLILPENLTLSSITHSGEGLRVVAVQKREYAERAPEHDDRKEADDGTSITLKAYIDHVSRTLVVFEWDLLSNTAMLQISQLHGDRIYEQVRSEFFALVGDWLEEKMFAPVDIRPAVRALQDLEGGGMPEARSHGIDYRSREGRILSARSPSSRLSVLGEAEIDSAMEGIRNNGVGHLGNFFWLPNGYAANPLKGDVHVILVAAKSRVNFPTPNTEDVVRYVLQRVRALS